MTGFAEYVTRCQNDPWFRLNDCYYIINKQSEKVKFRLNEQQAHLYKNKHNRNIVLKARQIGSTTFWCLYFLDKALWNDNQQIGIISHSIDSAQGIFRRIRFALDCMPPEMKDAIGMKQDSARQVTFRNNSLLRVDTTMRSETLSGLLVSELGRIAAHYPAKAEEVLTGALNTLSSTAECCIESTAEGADGVFFDLCTKSMAMDGEELTPLDYKFHFYSWHTFSEYSID